MDYATLPKIPFEDLSSASYTLTKRKTSKKIASLFVQKFQNAKSAFEKEVANALDQLQKNFAMAHKMDIKLGVPTGDTSSESEEDSEKADPRIQKDGTRRLSCPFLPCKVKTFKLKRHIANFHPEVITDQIDFGINVSRLFEKNKKKKTSFKPMKIPLSDRGNKNKYTALVNRRSNYKRCSLCPTLCLNMTNHIKRTHRIDNDDPRYYSLVTECPVVPKCYLKMVDNKAVELSGEELEEARVKFSTKVESQENTLRTLRDLREKISDAKRKLDESEEDSKQELQEILRSLYVQYSNERYKDNRIYTENVFTWKGAFINHLDRIECIDSKRVASMAIDVLLPYELKTGQQLSYDNLLDGKIMRELLADFKEKSLTSSASKIKYINSFQKLLNFLTFDIDSPENGEMKTNEQLLIRERNFSVVQFEIESTKKIISKGTGAERIKSRKVAKEKLITQEETDKLLEEIDEYLSSTLQKIETEEDFSKDDVIKIRDHLMAASTLRMGRRSKELITMKEEEARNGKKNIINKDTFFVIEVLDQKSTKSGKAAAVVLNEIEYKVLILYLDKLKIKISESKTIVFPSSSTTGKGISSMLSFGAACNILKKFKTETGKKLTTRVARASKVTNSRNLNLSLSDQRKLADAMNHSHAVSERYYNFNEASDAAVAVLSFDAEASNDRISTSTPVKRTVAETDKAEKTILTLRNKKIELNKNDCNSNDASGSAMAVLSSDGEASNNQITASTPGKRTLSETEEADETILTLRNKKIKLNKSHRKVQIVFLRKRIEELISDFKSKDKLNTLKTATGKVNINPIKELLSKSTLKMFSSKEIKEAVVEILD